MDNGSVVDTLMYSAYKGMGFDEAQLRSAAPIYDFGNNTIKVKMIIPLQVRLRDGENTVTEQDENLIVIPSYAYNAIFGRPLMKKMKMTSAIYCLMVKFSTLTSVGFMKSRQEDLRQCHLTSLELTKKGAKSVNTHTTAVMIAIPRNIRA